VPTRQFRGVMGHSITPFLWL